MLQVDGLERRPLSLGRRELVGKLTPRLRTPGTRTMIVGEAGIGKTYLVDALLETSVVASGVLRTRLRPENSREPYFAIRDLIRGADSPVRRRTRSRHGGPREVPVRELAGTVRATLRHLAKSGVVVVIDGWQWLDRESCTLLQQTLEEPDLRRSVIVLATRRLDDSAEDLAVQPLFGASDLFAVEALPPRAIIELVRASVRSHVSDAAAADIGRASRGNPLLALELAAAGDGRDPRRDMPRAFSSAMRERVQALEPDVQLLLATLAVTGPARSAEIAMLCERANDATKRALELGLVLRHGEELVVANPLLAALAADQLSDESKQHMHAMLAGTALPENQRIEHRDDATSPGVDEDLATELFEQSARAQRADEPESALRLIRRSLNRTDRYGPVYWERSVIAAELAATLANSTLALHLLRDVDFERIDLPLLDRAIPLLALTLARRGGTTAVRLRLLPLRGAVESSAAKDVITLQLVTIGWEGRAADQAVELARVADRLNRFSTPRSWRVCEEWIALLRLDQGGGLCDGQLSAIQAAEPTPMQFEDSVAVLAASWAYQSDDLSRSRAGLTAMVRAAGLRGEGFVVVQSLAHLAIVEMLAGRTDRAVPYLEQADAGAAGLTDIPPSLLAAKGMAAVRRDDGDALQILIDDPHGLGAVRRGLMGSHALLGLHAAYSGDWERALDELLHARQEAEQQGIQEPGRRYWIDIELARAFIATDDLTAAETVATHLDTMAGTPTRPHARGQALRIRGLVACARGEHTSAVDLLRSAIVELDRGGFRPELVRARSELALALHAVGAEPESARQLEIARLEAERVADPRLDGLLRGTAQKIEDESPSSSLTDAEMRVAVLAASGDTNRRIAEKLFLSPRTVETHLASTYRKLGVRTRTQMGLLLQRPTTA